MRKVYSTVACNLDTAILSACMPLFEASHVDAIEWSFDALYKRKEIPEWFTQLLQHYSNAGRLTGHGVFFSIFSGKWLPEQELWLQELKKISTEYKFDHVTEHFGFMTGRDFHHGAPLSIPYSATTLAIGRDRLKRIQDACSCPVGLENLAFAYRLEEVKRHGMFLSELIAPINGFIILDLHNLYCQLHNFDVSYDDIIKLYPLDSVREIHISGGSWDNIQTAPGNKVRRDTHDDGVPEEVFELLQRTINQCPNLKFVVMEQVGPGLKTAEQQEQYRKDFLRMRSITEQACTDNHVADTNTFLPLRNILAEHIAEDEHLNQQQLELSGILEQASDHKTASELLSNSSLANTPWNVENWTPYMLETALRIAQKWKA